MTTLNERTAAWLGALDAQIGDTETEIDRRRQSNAAAVDAREDLCALIAYLAAHDLPLPVKRALERCLAWNPHASVPGGTP